MRSLGLRKYLRVASAICHNFIKGEAIFPFYASLKLTNRCHFRCSFCNVWREKTPELPAPEFCKLLENLGRSSVILVSFEGGEPLLRDDLEELLRFARSQPFYLLFTTSERDLLDYPMERYAPYIDFLHVSIDEGHRNLELFGQLEELKKWNRGLCVQTVVTCNDLDSLPWKVERCHQAGAKILVMPAVRMEGTEDLYPNAETFQKTCLELKRRYPKTVISPRSYYEKLSWEHGCTASSIIVDTDGKLFYPCKNLNGKGPDLTKVPLREYLLTPEAHELRRVMSRCDKRCGWYQYFATSSFTSLKEVWIALEPYWGYIFSRAR
jgi:MoaA/NifB/PqqE/SkfB family radical SAM enzyme